MGEKVYKKYKEEELINRIAKDMIAKSRNGEKPDTKEQEQYYLIQYQSHFALFVEQAKQIA